MPANSPEAIGTPSMMAETARLTRSHQYLQDVRSRCGAGTVVLVRLCYVSTSVERRGRVNVSCDVLDLVKFCARLKAPLRPSQAPRVCLRTE